MPDDWRVQTLPDGRLVEFIDAEWAADDGSESAGSIRVKVTALIGDTVHSATVLLTSEQIEEGFRHAG